MLDKNFLNENEDDNFQEAKNKNYLWCSIDGYTPTKIKTCNCQNLQDVKTKLHKKFRKCDMKKKQCWLNGRELPLEMDLDQIDYNSFTNPIVFIKHTDESKNFLKTIFFLFKS